MCSGHRGSLLYYAQSMDNKLMMTLSAIGPHQAAATENTLAEVNKLLNNVTGHPSDTITYPASNMILAAHSDASFLSKPKACSQAGAHIFVSENDPVPQTNRPVLSVA